MSVKAQWATVAIEADDTDPFADGASIEDAAHVPTVGLPIDLNASEASLSARLADSLRYEGNLADQGAECGLKWSQHTTCFACPLYEGDGGDTPLAKLCRLGREQDTLTTLIAVRQHGQRR